MVPSIQLCDGGAKVQLCDGGAKVQLCLGAAPDSCPCVSWPDPPTSGDFPCGGLAYEYEVAICGATKTVTVDTSSCTWIWTGTPFTGCGGSTFDRVLLELGAGKWVLTCDQVMGDVCTYHKTTGAVPTGTYTLHLDAASGVCEGTATVEEAI